MATEAKARYSDAELDEFKKLIEVKINKAQEDLELLKSAYMNDGNNGTDDTSPTFKAFEEDRKQCPKKQTHSWLSVRRNLSVI
jgi:hypothetical protein